MNRFAIAGIALVACGIVAFALFRTSPAQPSALIEDKGIDNVNQAGAGRSATTIPADGTPRVPVAADDKGVMVITDEVLLALDKGLQTEIDLQDALEKELAAMKTPEQYQACSGQVMSSAGAMEILMRVGHLPDNATLADVQKLSDRNKRDLEALSLKTCGRDITQVDVRQRLSDIRRRAAAAAAAALK